MMEYKYYFCPIEIVIPPEAYGSIMALRQFYHRLSLTIQRPDLLAQELYARGVIDESTEVCVLFVSIKCYSMYIDCFGMLSYVYTNCACNRWLHKKGSV